MSAKIWIDCPACDGKGEQEVLREAYSEECELELVICEFCDGEQKVVACVACSQDAADDDGLCPPCAKYAKAKGGQ